MSVELTSFCTYWPSHSNWVHYTPYCFHTPHVYFNIPLICISKTKRLTKSLQAGLPLSSLLANAYSEDEAGVKQDYVCIHKNRTAWTGFRLDCTPTGAWITEVLRMELLHYILDQSRCFWGLCPKVGVHFWVNYPLKATKHGLALSSKAGVFYPLWFLLNKLHDISSLF